jgi:hypothetical protein
MYLIFFKELYQSADAGPDLPEKLLALGIKLPMY